ncbi:MAG: hypothetical protein FWE32_01705 [Oscillospiraceae bacterium]|nr:hypothetical protein [Oscillospiraceae bacterium]
MRKKIKPGNEKKPISGGVRDLHFQPYMFWAAKRRRETASVSGGPALCKSFAARKFCPQHRSMWRKIHMIYLFYTVHAYLSSYGFYNL